MLLVLTLAVLLVGCSQQTRPPEHVHSRGPSTIAPGSEYVALGDSYTSAPAVGATSGLPACKQTDANYPHLVAKALDLHLDDVSCAGADTADMTAPQALGPVANPPQLDAVTSSTKLVTLGIGANDENAFANLLVTCGRAARTDPSGSPCTRAIGHPETVFKKWVASTSGRILAVIKQIAQRAPKARILVIGYPQIFPSAAGCSELPFATGDLPTLHRANLAFRSAAQRAAQQAKVGFVDPWKATAGHDICGPDPWIAGLRPVGPAAAFHPYASEEVAVADLVVRALRK